MLPSMPILVPPDGPCPAPIMIVGEAPGEQEIIRGKPFVGYSGQELDRMLHQSGIMRSACFTTNVVRERPARNDITKFIPQRKSDITTSHVYVRGKAVLPCVRDGIELLRSEIAMCKPNVIIALGDTALWALTGCSGITKWRGSLLTCDLDGLNIGYKPKVIPTYHPAAILRQWEWRAIALMDLRKARRQSASSDFPVTEYKFEVRPTYEQAFSRLTCLLNHVLDRPTKLAVDLETRVGHIACIGIAWSKTEAICIPLMCVERSEGYWTENEEAMLLRLIHRLLTHPNVRVIGQNFLYDAQYTYRHWHFVPRVSCDTMIAQHVCWSNLPKGIDFISSMYRENHVYWKDEGKEWDISIPEDQYWRYNCMDAVATFDVEGSLQSNIDQMGLREVDDFQQKLFWPVLRTMNRGLRVDEVRKAQFAEELQKEITARAEWFEAVLGYPLNPRSTPQMKALFYEDLQQKPIINRKTKALTCDDEALNKIAERQPLLRPLVKKILEYRSLGVFYSTFIMAKADIDGRMRCSFKITGTETYRFASSENAFGSGLNLQNIPKGGAEDKNDPNALVLPNVRTLFIPDEGMTFFDIDLSAADLRIVVWESDEPEMKAMFREGKDPYTEIAKEFYRDPSIKKDDPRRQKFKSFAHGTNYLGTPKGLAERLGLTVIDAERTMAWYFSRFPRIKQWQDRLKRSLEEKKMVQNAFGYRCYFFSRIEGTVYNQAAAWIPQSTVGCLINRAYERINRRWPYKPGEPPEVEILLQVHDSLAGQFPTENAAFYKEEILRLASIEIPYPGDPLIIPVDIKTSTKSWGDCEKG